MSNVRLEEYVPHREARARLHETLADLQKRGISFLIGGMTSVNCLVGEARVSLDVGIFFEPKKLGVVLHTFQQHGFKGRRRFQKDFIPLTTGLA